MKTVDRLIIKAKRKKGVKQLINAFIRQSNDGSQWIVDASIWDGIKGSGVTSEICSCNSIEEAEAALQGLGKKYPNNKDIPVFIDDIVE